MSNKELTIIAIKVFAIYLLVQVVASITQIGDIYYHADAIDEYWLLLLPMIVITGLLFIFYSLWKLSSNVSIISLKPTRDKSEFILDQIFVLQLVGAYLFIVGLLSIVQGLIQIYYVLFWVDGESGYSAFKPEIKSQTIYFIIANLIKTIIGISLIIRSNVWVRLFNKFRRLGVEK
ncbi:MAG TPA: hypothetical protein PK055_12540 [Gammaproteobacteria bacterium]|nr:hypothetical protein [Xanthomonadales bacterium]MCB1595399.1 hypothetical protein [Xanthomonadales bacterium]HPI97045.1 hypothetical protein [Gammaproteobacteria bacterium]HPQ88474.1 hypothetical protein [Gammaproteobacteria bacterium]